jgi:hypothetical protein
MKSKVIFFFLLIPCSFLSAQTLNINTIEVCAGQEVFLPVTAASLTNVGAITLFIGFDTTNLTYVSIENIDPQLTGMSMNMMTLPAQLAFAWSSTTPSSFLNDKLFDLKFVTNGQTSTVSFNPGCEIADPLGSVIPVQYSNGAINSSLPIVLVQPKDSTITEGNRVSFTVSSPNAVSYFWKESLDQGTSWTTLDDGGIYSGTNSDVLSIFPTPLSYDKNQYQCVLIKENCVAISVAAVLSVDALTSTEDVSGPGKKNLSISPAPFTDHINAAFNLPVSGNALLQVMNLIGEKIIEIDLPAQNKGLHNILLNTSGWPSGMYFFTLTMTSRDKKIHQIVKAIKSN